MDSTPRARASVAIYLRSVNNIRNAMPTRQPARSVESGSRVETIARLDVRPSTAFTSGSDCYAADTAAGCNERSVAVFHRKLISKHVYSTLILDLPKESVYT